MVEGQTAGGYALAAIAASPLTGIAAIIALVLLIPSKSSGFPGILG